MKQIISCSTRRLLISLALVCSIILIDLFSCNNTVLASTGDSPNNIVLASTGNSSDITILKSPISNPDYNSKSANAYFKPEKPSEGSLEELYQDVFMVMLMPYIQTAVNNYYEKNTGYSPSVDPWQPEVLYIARPNGYRTFMFIIKLEIEPYLGAHNTIGVDHITIRVSSGEVRVEKFEHIKDKPVPPWLQRNSARKGIKAVIAEGSIQQNDWSKLPCQQKEYFLERLIMSNFAYQINKAVESYYKELRGFDVEKITDIKLSGIYGYEMKIQISTYVGAHNPPYGLDLVTIRFSRLCDGKVVDFEHHDTEEQE